MFNKLKGRYAEKKAKKERAVISYEDMPLDDYEPERTDLSPKIVKRIVFGVLGALLLALIVFVFANREKLTWDNISVWWSYEMMGTASKDFPVNIVGSEVTAGNITVNKSRIAYASDTSFVTLNSKGAEVNNAQLRYTKPVMKAADNHFLIFGLGEKNFQLESFDKSVYSGTAEGNIYAGDIAPNGRYCLAVEGNGFYSELYAFDSDNNRVYKYAFSEYYINSVAINLNGTGCIACGMSNNNGEIKTGIYMLDFSREEPVGKYEIAGDYIIDSRFISAGRAALVGSNASYVAMTDEDMARFIDQVNTAATISYDAAGLTLQCRCPTLLSAMYMMLFVAIHNQDEYRICSNPRCHKYYKVDKRYPQTMCDDHMASRRRKRQNQRKYKGESFYAKSPGE